MVFFRFFSETSLWSYGASNVKKKVFFSEKSVSESRMMTSPHSAIINRYHVFGWASRINVDYKYKIQWMTMTSASFLNKIGPMPASPDTSNTRYPPTIDPDRVWIPLFFGRLKKIKFIEVTNFQLQCRWWWRHQCHAQLPIIPHPAHHKSPPHGSIQHY